MTEIAIVLNRPALTPEVRAWITNWPGRKRPVLTRGHDSDLNRGTVLLRIEVDADTDEDVRDQVESLLTDLRMLGLGPKLLEQDPA